jgi:hypothetical protein
MRRIASRLAVILAGVLLFAAAPGHGGQTLISAHLTGTIAGDLVDGRVQVLGVGTGRAGRYGQITAQALWAPSLEAAMQLLTGQVDELTITSGDFSAELEDGSRITGTLSGRVGLQGASRIRILCEFVVTDASGSFVGAAGDGWMQGWADFETLAFHVTLHTRLARP